MNKVITVCYSNKEQLAKHGVDADKVRVIYNGVDLTQFPLVNKIPLKDKFNIGIVARLIERKGHSDLIRALAKLNNGSFHLQTHLTIIGDGPLRGRLEQMAQSLGLTGQISFLGDRHDVPKLLEELDVVVLPSSYEAFPVTIIEALGSGLPVVATAVDGIPEVIKHQETGLLVQPHDIDGLAHALATIARDAGLRQRLSQNGSRLVRKKFSVDQMVEAYEEEFRTLVETVNY